MLAFGPVPSRRLGQSLGINNIPTKFCTYSCVYCQVGRTDKKISVRKEFYQPEDIFCDAQSLLVKVRKKNRKVDYFTFVPTGEPTLDINLGNEIELLKFLDIKIAVITNGSLISLSDVKRDLMKSDYISIKIDSIDNGIWNKVNRPIKNIKLPQILEGIFEFSKNYHGQLVTETMLIDGINTNEKGITDIANFLSLIDPDISYLSIPWRPPCQKWARIPDENTINQCYQIFKENLDNVEHLIGYEGNAFTYTGNVEKDILNITAVHPMQKEAVEHLLNQAHVNWDIINRLITSKKLIESEYGGHKFYMRHLPERTEMNQIS